MGTFKLSSLITYAGKWEITDKELLSKVDPEGFKAISSAHIVETEQDWGISRSICLTLVKGGNKYISLSRDNDLEDGTEVDVNSIEILTLSRDGDDDIYKADCQPLTSNQRRKK